MDNNSQDRVNTPDGGSSDDTRGTRQGRFVVGLATGAMLGVSIGLWLAPRASVLRQWLDESARDLGTHAAERSSQASATVASAIDSIASTAQTVRDGVAETVVRGANEVARLASTVKS